MPSETPTDLIRRNSDQIASLVARVDHFERDLDRIEGLIKRSEERSTTSERTLQEIDKRVAVVTRDTERLEKRLDEILSRRFELSKLVLAAFLGGILTLVTGFLGRWLERITLPPQQTTGVSRPAAR